MELEQYASLDEIKDLVQTSKNMKKAAACNDGNIPSKRIEMNTIVKSIYVIKIPHLRNIEILVFQDIEIHLFYAILLFKDIRITSWL